MFWSTAAAAFVIALQAFLKTVPVELNWLKVSPAEFLPWNKYYWQFTLSSLFRDRVSRLCLSLDLLLFVAFVNLSCCTIEAGKSD